MATLTALQKLLKNPKTARFAETLNHADLPAGWADDPEIVKLAEDVYKEQGTESPFWQAAFGNSKVVDKDGNPLVVYHGSKSRNIQEFSKDKIGKGASKGKNLYGDGFYFTPDYYSAQTYGKKIYDAYLNIENPSISGSINPGQDGIMVHAGWHPTYVAFEPTQIKSVHNRGTFNPNDPNIYKGILGALATGGAAAGATTGEAQAGEWTPETIARAYPNGLPGQQEAFATFSRPMQYTVDPLHSLSSGARAVTEGILGAPGELANIALAPFTDFRFSNPGQYLADAMGQARPVTGAEKAAFGIVRGASDALPYIATGAGMAKLGGGAVQGVGRALADSPRAQAVLGGILGLLGNE